MLNFEAIQPLIDLSLHEDVGDGDKTTQAIITAEAQATARLTAKADGVVAGLPVAERVFNTVDPTVIFKPTISDGDVVATGQIIAHVTGAARSLLTGERLALNFLQRLSGIATLTARYVRAVHGTSARIIDTRKTAPGFRILDKYAVKCGGGANHRMGLYDMILIKDNHIDVAGSITEAVRRARQVFGESLLIEVETRTMEEVQQALQANIDRILLDNMPLDTLRQAVTIAAGRTPLEASGGVNLDTVREIARTGVDYISVGALTHSVIAFDISMTMEIG